MAARNMSTAVGNRCGGPWLACDRSPARSLQRLQTISSSISLSRERERKAGGNRSRPLWTLGRWLTEERNIGEPAYDQASVTGRGYLSYRLLSFSAHVDWPTDRKKENNLGQSNCAREGDRRQG